MANFGTFLTIAKALLPLATPAGLRASFSVYSPLLHQVEGGFQKHPDDPGNYNSLGELVGTNFGISARFYESIIGRPPSEADMLAITKTEATQLFKTFWNTCQADLIHDQYVANTIVDHHINAGSGIRLAQQVLNNNFGYKLAIDNAMGPITLNAINQTKPDQFVEKYNTARANYYRSISNQSFLEGWLKRLKKFAYKHKAATFGSASLLLIGIAVFAIIKLK